MRVTGAIGPVRRSLVGDAKAWLGELAQSTGQRLDLANAVLTRLANGGEAAPVPEVVEQFTRPSNLTGLESGGSGLVDSANGLPLARMDRGLMSLQVDPRIVDSAGIALPVAGFAGKTALDVARALPAATAQAGREFLTAGATGTRIWAGPKSATWNAGKARGFEDFEKAGGTPDGLWQAFGTGRLKDGSLIQEIDDSKAALKTDFAVAKPLNEVVDHPDFETAYPQLAKDIKVTLQIDPAIRGRGTGGYNSELKSIEVTAPNMKEARRLVLHEMQHAVSRFEGRATGGSPRKAGAMVQAALDDPNTSPELREKLKSIMYNDFEAYQRLQDEVLAREVEARRDYGADRRESSAPLWDRDPEDWIVSRDTEPGISMGQGYAPKKTVKAYKLFRVDPKHPGKLFPLFVEADKPVPIGEWVEAVAGAPSKDGKGVASKIGQLAYRPGWHAGDLPIATHIGAKSKKGAKAPDTRPDNHVWAEVEMPADKDWQSIANERGKNKQGRVVPVKAHITDEIPKNGFYRYKTNPNMTGEWLISGNMRVNRVLDDAEVAAINSKAGVADLPRAKPFDRKAYGFGDNVDMALDPEAGRMPGLPESVALPDGARAAVEPISDLRRIALDFMREKGLDPNLTTDEFRRVDPARGKAIADTFEAMKNDPTNPVVQASYRALIEDVKGQWDALQKLGYRFSFIEPGMPDPYAASPRLAIEDLKKNKHLWVYPTDSGFGNADAVAQSATNPLLAPTGVKIGDRELVANDLFRIVHDVWGHAKEGVGFRADGEENAWLQHLPTFRPQSRMALTTETRGQNSWLNFGPHGEANRTASAADTVFAPQKVGDLPAWVMDPNGMPPIGPRKSQATLNIGLKIGDTGNLDPNEALAALRGLGIDVTEMGIVQSGTEPTLVVGLNRAMAPGEAEMLARAIKQEAIAQKTGRSGALFGPGKEKWGPFNEDYFLNLKQLRAATKPPKAPVTKDEIALLTGEEKDIAKSLISASNAKADAKAPPVTRGEVQDGVWNRAVYRGEKAATPGPKASEEEWARWGDQYGVNVRRSDDVEVAPGVSIPGGLDGTFTIADIFELKARKIDPSSLPREVHDALMQKFIRTYDIPNPDPVDVFNRLAFAQLSPNAPLLQNEFLLQRLRATSMDDIRSLASREGQADLAKALDRESGVGAAARGGMGLKGTADLANLAKLARAVIEKPEMFRAQPGETLRDVGLRVMNQIPGLGPKTVSLGVPWLDLPHANTSAVDLHMIRNNYERLLTDDRVGSDFVDRMAGLLKVEPNLSAVQAKIAEDPKGAEQAAINIIGGSSRSKVYRSKKTGDVNPEIPASLQPNLLLNEPKQATFFNEFYDRIVDFVNDSRGTDPTLALFPEQWRLWDGYRGRVEPHEFAHPDFRKLPKQSFNEMQAALKANRRAGFGDSDKVKKTRDRVDWRELYYGKASPELLALIAAGGGAAATLPLLSDEE